MRIGVGLPIWGTVPEEHGLRSMVRAVADVGLDGVWVGDHVALSTREDSPYPYRDDGRFFLDPGSPWYEAVTCLGHVAAFSGDLDLGLGVALPVLRPPALFAKQLATVSRLANGQLLVGVGAGWLRAEFEAVGLPWKQRGTRMEHAVQVLRAYWTGTPTPGDHGPYTVPEGITSFPTPKTEVPVLVGGNSSIALERAGRIGDGWIGAANDWIDDEGDLPALLEAFHASWRRHQPDRTPLLALVQAVPGKLFANGGFDGRLAARFQAINRLGVEQLVLNISWRDLEQTRDQMRRISVAAGRGD